MLRLLSNIKGYTPTKCKRSLHEFELVGRPLICGLGYKTMKYMCGATHSEGC